MNVSVHRHDPNTQGEAAILYAIYFEAIRDGARAHYTTAQRRAWAPDIHMPDGWFDRLAELDTYVAETDGDIAGFMAATRQGHIDLAFVRPRWMGRDVAQALYERIAERARDTGLTRLTTHASLMARPFFARNGWQVDATEMIDRNGETLKRFAMSLTLGDPHDHTYKPRG